MKKSVSNQARIKEQLDDLDDYRPYFTYWVTTVQVVILFISLFTYGFGPPGIDLNRRSGLVSFPFFNSREGRGERRKKLILFSVLGFSNEFVTKTS